jgi:hypothetical protein
MLEIMKPLKSSLDLEASDLKADKVLLLCRHLVSFFVFILSLVSYHQLLTRVESL